MFWSCMKLRHKLPASFCLTVMGAKIPTVSNMPHPWAQQSACNPLLSGARGRHPNTQSEERIAVPRMPMPQTWRAGHLAHTVKIWCKVMDTAGTVEILTVLKGRWGIKMQTVIHRAVDGAAILPLSRYRRKRMAPTVLEARVGLFCSRGQLTRAATTAHPVCCQSQAGVESQPDGHGTRAKTQGHLRLLRQAIGNTFFLQLSRRKGRLHLGPMEAGAIVGSR